MMMIMSMLISFGMVLKGMAPTARAIPVGVA